MSDLESKLESESESESEPESKNINVSMFICNIILGIIYLGIAVIFIIIVYLEPLASEDLFSYLFNVVQFIIRQYFYKLIVGKSFSIKKILKTVHEIISNPKEYNEYKPHEKENLDRKTGRLVAALIGPQLPPQEQATDTTIQES